MGSHTASSAAAHDQAPTEAAGRPRSIRASPKIAITAATIRGRTIGATTAADGMRRSVAAPRSDEKLAASTAGAKKRVAQLGAHNYWGPRVVVAGAATPRRAP